jgi:uncharacterized FlaG/YvyC family protein
MEGLTFSASHQGGSTELRTPKPVQAPVSSTGEATAQRQPASEETRAPGDVPNIEAQESPFQARLNYDREKATLFVEILDRATGDVIQRIPAETAAERIHELTGSYGGAVIDKIA